MKKFFSLLCATMLVLSASAAPVAKKAELVKKAPVAVEQVQKVQFEEAQSVKTLSLENAQLSNQLNAAPALKVNNQKATAPVKASKKAVKANHAVAPAKAPQAGWDTIGKSTVKDGVVAYLLGDTQDAAAYQVTTLQQGTTYKMVNLFGSANPAYNAIKDLASYKKAEIEIDATDANNVTIAKQKIGWTGVFFSEVYEIEASNGKSANGVITFAAANIKFYEDGETPYSGYGDLVITLPKQEEPTPTLADRYDATGLVSKDGGNTWSEAPAWVATVGANQYGPCITNLIPQGPFANPVALNYVTVGNQIVLPATPLTQVSQTELVYAMDITDFLTGGTGDIVLNVAQDGNISANPSHLYGYLKATFDASTYAPTEMTGVYQIYGNLAYSIAKPITERDTVDIVSTDLKYNDLIASNKVTIYYATDVEGYYLFRVTSNNATSVDGTFKWSDGTINNPNSYFSVSGTDKNYFTDGEFTVVTNNKDIALTGWMIGEDEKYYRLNMSYTAPTERDTLKFSGQGVTISECISSQTGVQTGWFYQLADASTGYEFLLQSTVVAEQYGTFSYADKTLGSNYYNVFDPQGNKQQFVEGSITVSNDGSEIVLDGELIAEDEKVYVLHFTQSASVLNYDADAPFDATFAYEDMKASIKEGVIGIYATNAENYTIGLELYADPAATEIPAGVYTISDTQEAGTALQSLGIAGGYLTECFAGTRGASGINVPCWFMVEGTITLSYDEYGKLKVVVDAKNSYGQPVTALVQYTAEVTDYYLVGWINNAAYGIEDDIDNFGDYHFVDGKVRATFNELSYVQVKDNNKQIYGTDSYIAPAEMGNATLVANGPEKIAINGGAEYEYTLVVNEDGSLTLSYAVVTTDLRNAKANVKAAKQIKNGQIVIVRENKEYNILGAAL